MDRGIIYSIYIAGKQRSTVYLTWRYVIAPYEVLIIYLIFNFKYRVLGEKQGLNREPFPEKTAKLYDFDSIGDLSIPPFSVK